MENFTFVQFPISQFCICGSPNSANILSLCKSSLHCVKSVQIRSCLFLYSVNLRIQSEYRKIQTRNNSVFGHFSHNMAVINTPFHRIKYWKHFIITILFMGSHFYILSFLIWYRLPYERLVYTYLNCSLSLK